MREVANYLRPRSSGTIKRAAGDTSDETGALGEGDEA